MGFLVEGNLLHAALLPIEIAAWTSGVLTTLDVELHPEVFLDACHRVDDDGRHGRSSTTEAGAGPERNDMCSLGGKSDDQRHSDKLVAIRTCPECLQGRPLYRLVVDQEVAFAHASMFQQVSEGARSRSLELVSSWNCGRPK